MIFNLMLLNMAELLMNMYTYYEMGYIISLSSSDEQSFSI